MSFNDAFKHRALDFGCRRLKASTSYFNIRRDQTSVSIFTQRQILSEDRNINSRVLSLILDVHTLARHLDPAAGRLHNTRSITVRSPPLPFILRRALGGEDAVVCHCVESSVINARNRSMDIVSRNATLRGLIEVEERSCYQPHPDRPDEWTIYRQETSIRCRPLSALAAIAEKVEQRCAERFLQNSVKGREVIERICKYLEAESGAAAFC